jgi:hypothetical protein
VTYFYVDDVDIVLQGNFPSSLSFKKFVVELGDEIKISDNLIFTTGLSNTGKHLYAWDNSNSRAVYMNFDASLGNRTNDDWVPVNMGGRVIETQRITVPQSVILDDDFNLPQFLRVNFQTSYELAYLNKGVLIPTGEVYSGGGQMFGQFNHYIPELNISMGDYGGGFGVSYLLDLNKKQTFTVSTPNASDSRFTEFNGSIFVQNASTLNTIRLINPTNNASSIITLPSNQFINDIVKSKNGYIAVGDDGSNGIGLYQITLESGQIIFNKKICPYNNSDRPVRVQDWVFFSNYSPSSQNTNTLYVIDENFEPQTIPSFGNENRRVIGGFMVGEEVWFVYRKSGTGATFARKIGKITY